MKINNILPNYNTAKTTFGAMRKRAARVLISQAKNLNEEQDRQKALEQIYYLAKRAKNSSILDIEAYAVNNGDKVVKGLAFIDTSRSPEQEITRIPLQDIKKDETKNCVVIDTDSAEVPIEDFIADVENKFSTYEHKTLSEKSQSDRLISAIMGISK